MKVEQSGFTPLQFQNNNIQRVQPSAPQDFPDISKIQKTETDGVTQNKSINSVSSQPSIQGGSLSQYLNQEEKDMINRLFPANGQHQVGIQAYRQTQVPIEPQEKILGQQIDITT